MKTRNQFIASVKRSLIRRGLNPIKAVDDEGGNCIYCGEAGRCPGWHYQGEKGVTL